MSGLLFLTGMDLSNRTDSQMQFVNLSQSLLTIGLYAYRASTYAFIPDQCPTLNDTPLATISQLPTYKFAPKRTDAAETDAKSVIPLIPGGGITRRFLSSLPQKWPVPTACILQFVLEGDNQADAEYLANIVAKALKLSISQWKRPSSWRVGLFGTPHDQSLYG